jgi:phosphatidylglycerol:prolipoprotein diacylglycerol transferase
MLLYLGAKKNLSPEKIAGLALIIFLGGVLGAKTLPLIFLLGGLFNNINLLFSQQGGAMFMGGLAGALLFGGLYIKLVKLSFWETADLLVLPTVLGIGISRIGCALINDHQGLATNLPWGILWPDGVLRHPVGIYESLAGFILFGIFWWIRNKNNNTPTRKDGYMSLLFLVVYSEIRFFLEFTRESEGLLADPRWGILSVSQWLALGIIFVSVVVGYKFCWRLDKNADLT